ncbi:hypothetical protein, partial [Alistipes putredinis]|uniref:hypothetical protein n=1 Tax=Alistipes putredinis TaxID=28117 RepID=UPI003995AF6D
WSLAIPIFFSITYLFLVDSFLWQYAAVVVFFGNWKPPDRAFGRYEGTASSYILQMYEKTFFGRNVPVKIIIFTP